MNDRFVLDKDSHIPVFSEICTYCQHLDVIGERKCTAFPNGIPMSIWLGENDHHLPYPGDHNIQFTPAAKLVPTQEPTSFVKSEKRTKTRKRRFLTRPYLEQDAKLRAHLWQNPQVRADIVAEMLGTTLTAAEAKDISIIETRWLNPRVAVKSKNKKDKFLSKK